MAKPEPAPPQTTALADRLRTELDLIERLLEGLLVLARVHHGDMAWLVVETGGPVLDQRKVQQLAQPFRRLGSERTGCGSCASAPWPAGSPPPGPGS